MTIELFTGRYNNPGVHHEIIEGKVYPVGHTVGNPPRGFGARFRHRNLRILGPDRDWLGLSREDYEPLYVAKLDVLGLDSVAWHLQGIVDQVAKPLVMLCFENLDEPGSWCHRRMFAAWWEAHTGSTVHEVPESTSPTPLGGPGGHSGPQRVSKAVQGKAHRLLADGAVMKVEGGWRVKGDSGEYDLNDACTYCSCPARVRCSHMIAAAMKKEGVQTLL